MERNKRKKKQKYGTWQDRLRYYKEENYRGYLALVFVVFNLLLLGVTILAMGTIADTTGMITKDIIWRGISVMLDPGNLEADPSLFITVILSLITIVGMISFSGGMIAFLSSMLNDHLENIRDGDTAIHFKHFTLFLGWNDRGLEILKTFMMKETQNSVTDFVVILSRYNGRELRERIVKQLREYLKYHEDAHELRILVRTGDPAEYGSLLMVDYLNADEVFILGYDEDEDMDFAVERTFFALTRAYSIRENGPAGAVSDIEVDIMVETMFEETAEMINRFHPRKEGMRRFTTEAFSMTQLLGGKYAEVLPEQEHITVCYMNEALPFMLEAIQKKAAGNHKPAPGLLLIVGEGQEKDAEKLYEDSRFHQMFIQAPATVHRRTELCERLVAELKSGNRGILILSPYDISTSGWEHRNFELWAEMEDKIESDPGLTKEDCNGVYFEMVDETDAQIIDGFDFGRCIISVNIVAKHMIEICREKGLLP